MAGRFGLVGLTATALHLSVLWVLLAQTSVPPLAANVLAFLSGFCVSLLGNYYWTFRTAASLKQAFRRFMMISSMGFLANEGMLAALLHVDMLSPVAAAFISVAVVPPVTYLASRFWGFRESSRAASLIPGNSA